MTCALTASRIVLLAGAVACLALPRVTAAGDAKQHLPRVALPVRPQLPAPDFSAEAVMPDGSFKHLNLKYFRGKYLVLFFYPMDFTFVCPTEIIAFSDRAKEFRKLGAEVAAVSTDTKFSHLAFMNLPRNEGGLGKMDIPLVADVTKQMAKDYGVLIEEGEDAGVALRGLFVINEKGVVRSVIMNDLPVGRTVDEALRLVEAFQYTDKFGEGCPANWNPGDDAIKTDPLGKLDYFDKKSK